MPITRRLFHKDLTWCCSTHFHPKRTSLYSQIWILRYSVDSHWQFTATNIPDDSTRKVNYWRKHHLMSWKKSSPLDTKSTAAHPWFNLNGRYIPSKQVRKESALAVLDMRLVAMTHAKWFELTPALDVVVLLKKCDTSNTELRNAYTLQWWQTTCCLTDSLPACRPVTAAAASWLALITIQKQCQAIRSFHSIAGVTNLFKYLWPFL